MRPFTAEEISELYRLHTESAGQVFAEEAVALTYELTRGHPWLVNGLAQQVIEQWPKPIRLINFEQIEKARQALVRNRCGHLDDLVEIFRRPQVQKILIPILEARLQPPDSWEDLRLVEELGIVRSGLSGYEIANPVYRQVLEEWINRSSY